MQYGFQRLVLLGSGGYSRAELPLDSSVSLVAPNNIGKTTLINALQYLLIIDGRRMDFGARDNDISRRFYFPNNSAYIMLEVLLPEVGTVVLGCVGKGVSFEYEYFVYAGPLNIDEFCLPDGTLVAQPQLAHHLATHGRRVFSYNSTEFADLIYGVRSHTRSAEQDFCVFRLENASDASVFQRILNRTLRLDRLSSSEVKDYLLKIFRRDLPDASIDFKTVWDQAFAGLNEEREQYNAALRAQEKGWLTELEKMHQTRLHLRGKIIAWRPLINQALSQWQDYYDSQQQALKNEQTEIKNKYSKIRDQDTKLIRQQERYEHEQQQLEELNAELEQLAQVFALIPEGNLLEQRLQELQAQRDAALVRIDRAQERSVDDIQDELARIDNERKEITQEKRHLDHNLYLELKQHLSATQLTALNKTLARQVLTLGQDHYAIDKTKLSAALSSLDERIELIGLTIHLDELAPQYQQSTAAELDEKLNRLQKRQTNLQQQLKTAQLLEEEKLALKNLEKDLEKLHDEVRDYARFEELQHSDTARKTRLSDLSNALHAIHKEFAQNKKNYDELDNKRQQNAQQLHEHEQKHKTIERLRTQRLDQNTAFRHLEEHPHHPLSSPPQEIPLAQLDSALYNYQQDCSQLMQLDDRLTKLLRSIQEQGLTKYEFMPSQDEQLSRLIDFAQPLPQEAEALEKKARAAVVNVATSLRELRDGLLSFKRRMNEFNRKIHGRQLSDLSVFKIEAEDEAALVQAIDLLISTAETADMGESLELFDQHSMLDDEQLEYAKTLLIEEGNVRKGLGVADLFNLRFLVGKTGQKPEAFDDIDSAASTGTVLMAKLVTGLAMLHLMLDPRRVVQGVCYLDEAMTLDARNQATLIDIAAEFGFALIFASPTPLTTVRYCVPIQGKNNLNHISRYSWQIIEPIASP